MTIVKTFKLECDACQDQSEEVDDFNVCVDIINRDGWITKKVDGGYYHFCDWDCYNEWKAEHIGD